MYAKLIDGQLNPAPKVLKKVVSNPNDADYIEFGYKTVDESAVKPDDGKEYVAQYIETDEAIVLTWIEVEEEPIEQIEETETISEEIIAEEETQETVE